MTCVGFVWACPSNTRGVGSTSPMKATSRQRDHHNPKGMCETLLGSQPPGRDTVQRIAEMGVQDRYVGEPQPSRKWGTLVRTSPRSSPLSMFPVTPFTNPLLVSSFPFLPAVPSTMEVTVSQAGGTRALRGVQVAIGTPRREPSPHLNGDLTSRTEREHMPPQNGAEILCSYLAAAG